MKPLLYSILPRPAHPMRDGLAIRNYHLLAALSSEFRVCALALVPPHLRGCGQYPPDVEVEEIPQAGPGPRRAAALARSAVTRNAFPVLLYGSDRLTARLRDRVARGRPAWIVAHSYHVADAAFEGRAPVWVDFHNVDSEIWRRMAQRATGLVRAFLRWQAPRVARRERDIASRACGVSCVSERDAQELASAGGTTPLLVPNGADLGRCVFRADPSPEDMVFFIGDLTWPPNVEGIGWFCSEVWPFLTRLRPSARVAILGRGQGAGLQRLIRRAPAGVVFLGEEEDTRRHWRGAAVAIVPLLAGGGTRLKILEAAARGVPVVSTPVGAEGLDFADGSEIRLAAGPREFAEAIADLLGDPGQRRVQAAAARRRVERQYDWREIGRGFARELFERSAHA